jgi:histidine triad (HIT) family protein
MSDCLFCKIAAGEIPAAVVTKNEEFLAFRDINPQAPTHVLAIPLRHVASLNEVKDGQLLGGLMTFARDVAREAGLANKGYRVVFNTNHDGGQTVNHLHLHILGGRQMHWPPG